MPLWSKPQPVKREWVVIIIDGLMELIFVLLFRPTAHFDNKQANVMAVKTTGTVHCHDDRESRALAGKRHSAVCWDCVSLPTSSFSSLASVIAMYLQK